VEFGSEKCARVPLKSGNVHRKQQIGKNGELKLMKAYKSMLVIKFFWAICSVFVDTNVGIYENRTTLPV
jgi:hypothetical protein